LRVSAAYERGISSLPGAMPGVLRVEGLGFGGWGLGFRVQGSGFSVEGLGLRV